jgi:aerobic-type carbon monoxide dehydrogenase small subunit (CoxS/CutS family)
MVEEKTMKVTFKINGKDRSVETDPLRRLIDIIRSDLNLKGTKEGCGEGECGSCSVIMNGRVVCSCLVPAFQIEGADILTIEGMGSEEELHPVQEAFIEEGAVQCGFCIPGMIMASEELLRRDPLPSRDTIKQGLAGNLCRCTGYEKIFRAVEKAAFTKKKP